MKWKINFIISILIVFSILFSGIGIAATDDDCNCEMTPERDLQILRDNMINSELADIKPLDLYNEAKGYLDTMNSGGFWDDIDFSQQPGSMWYGMRQLNRLRVIARAYMMPGQSLYQSDDAIKAIELGLPHVESKMLHQTSDGTLQTPGNWWFYNLDLPSKLGYVLTVAENKIDSKIFETSLNTLYFCLRNPTDWYLNPAGLIGGAANSVNGIKGNMFYAVLTKNMDSIKFLSECYRKGLAVTKRPDEGLREDGSHIAHGMLDFYLYFNDVITGTIALNDYFKNSSYSATDEEFDTFAACVCDGATWSIYQKVPDLKPRGRFVSGPFNDEQRQIGTVLKALKYVAKTECSYQQQAKELLARYNSGQEMHIGNRYFWEGDAMYHRSENSYVSLAMSSSRVKSAEAWSGQGNSTLYTGDGYMQIYDDAAEYYGDGFISCIDWSRLAGTTVLRNTPKITMRASYYTAEPYVGGVSNGQYGIAAMNYSQLTMPIYAHKSWFFFDDEVVCLGSGIESNSEEETHTYVDQRPERGGKFIVNGEEVNITSGNTKELKQVNWVANNGIGYYFPDSPDLMLQKENRDGSWTYLDANNFGGPLVNMGLSFLWFNHGSNAKDGSYAYAVLPAMTSEMTAKYADKQNFDVIEQSNLIHAVKDNSTDSLGVVFWPDQNKHASIVLSYDNSFFDGIYPYTEKGEPYDYYADEVEIAGKKGRVNHTKTTAMQGFEVSSQRLANDVDFTVCWFDDADAISGSWWKLKYHDAQGNVKETECIPYQYTDEWQTTTFHLSDINFDCDSKILWTGVDFVIEHSNAPVHSGTDKIKGEDTYYYGPVIHQISISPHGEQKNESYFETIEGISTDTPCIVYKKSIENGIELFVSEPTQQGKKIKMIIDGSYSSDCTDKDVLVYPILGGRTRIVIQTQKGYTYKIPLKQN